MLHRLLTFMLAPALLFAASLAAGAQTQTAIFAGGCFWCVESDFDKVEGVVATTSGFIGGGFKNPTYKQVTGGATGHYEAVKIEFDPSKTSYRKLIDIFWRTVDPTDADGQFCDRGDSYRTAVFATKGQTAAAKASRAAAQKALGQKIVTEILPVSDFYPADDYHQNYYQGKKIVFTRFGIITQSTAYKKYREACGRDRRVKELWGKDAPFAALH